ncbi:MAG: biotin--[acetyl-CoA-carboxylase] ligase [Bacteroidia bacterium]|nr:biotin--[acetyl-CoA-carboxylase] ligase [Bacteroidia bacterium]
MALFTGNNLLRYDALDSTNTTALNLLREHPPEGTVVLTRHQTAGRGQQGSVWLTPPDVCLTFSVIYYPHFLDIRDLFQLSKLAALAVCDTLEHFLPDAPAAIKWPNDLLIARRKVCGMLIENQLEGQRLRACVIGIGLNVNRQAFPPELAGIATAMDEWHAGVLESGHVLQYLLDRLETRYLALRAGGGEALSQAYLGKLLGYQEPMRMETPDGTIEGVILGVDRAGRLAVQAGASVQYFNIKEIRLIPGQL